MNKLHVRQGDTVMVISGKEKGQKGKVLKGMPKDNRVLIEGVNMIIRHTKPRGANQQGGRIQKEGPISASNVMLFCGKCNKPTRIAHGVSDGKKIRVCKHCGKSVD